MQLNNGGTSSCGKESLVSMLLAKLKVCKSLENVKRVHSQAVELGIESDVYLVNSLINRYSRCGSLPDARLVFDRLQHKRNLVSWNSLLFGYAAGGEEEMALELYSAMDLRPDARTFVAIIKACSSLASKQSGTGDELGFCLENARRIENDARICGCVSNVFVVSSLVDLYSRCGSLSDAWRVFSSVTHRDVACWNSFILGLVENGEGTLALEMLEKMSCSTDGRTFVAVLKACKSLGEKEDGRLIEDDEKKKVKMKVVALEKAMALHSEASRRGFDKDVFVGSCLVDLYSECGSMPDALRAFNRIGSRNVVSWNSLILGYAENGEGEAALEIFFCLMDCQPDGGSVVAALKACISLAAGGSGEHTEAGIVKLDSLEKGMRVHSKAASRALVNSDMLVMNSLVDMYSKCGSLSDSIRVFQSMPSRNVVTWNTLMLGCVECCQEHLALELYTEMREQGSISPNNRSYVPVLMACGALVELRLGKTIHAEILRKSGFESDSAVETCLVDLYGRCSCLVEAQLVFDSSPRSSSSVVLWNTLLTGYSRRGESQRVFHLFQEMRHRGVEADSQTFAGLLAACSHAGLVNRAWYYFKLMAEPEFGVEAELEHYHSMIDVLGRVNQLESAVEMVRRMRLKPTPVTWRIVLAACKKWNDLKVGEMAFESLMKLENGSSGYVLMSGLYRSERMNLLTCNKLGKF